MNKKFYITLEMAAITTVLKENLRLDVDSRKHLQARLENLTNKLEAELDKEEVQDE